MKGKSDIDWIPSKETLILHSTGIIFWNLQQHFWVPGPSAQEYDVIVIGHSWGSR